MRCKKEQSTWKIYALYAKAAVDTTKETTFLVWRFVRKNPVTVFSSFYFLNFELSRREKLVQSTDKYGEKPRRGRGVALYIA